MKGFTDPSEKEETQDRIPQVKVCGLTRPEEAILCAEQGAGAIGLVFYPPSPRFVTDEQAAAISAALPERFPRVGVFVNEGYSVIMRRVERCGLKAVQLHGQEPPQLVQQLRLNVVMVIKVLFANANPHVGTASSYNADAYLTEFAGGSLPGGNALAWSWERVSGLSASEPLILAGGLTSQNVGAAIQAVCPDAVDVSSGVETQPGRKDPQKLSRFLQAVSRCRSPRRPRRIFQ